MISGDISIRYVAYADYQIARDCCRIACEFLRAGDAFEHTIPYDVNVLRRPMFIAERQNGYVAGFILAKLVDKNAAEILSLYVRGNMHRMGIGTQLLTGMENYLRGCGIRKIDLVSRPMAVNFYNARGYIQHCSDKSFLQKSI